MSDGKRYSLEETFKEWTTSRKEMLDYISRYIAGFNARIKGTGDTAEELGFACKATMDVLKSTYDEISWRTEALARLHTSDQKHFTMIDDSMGQIATALAALALAAQNLKSDTDEIKNLKSEVARLKPLADRIDVATRKREEENSRNDAEVKKKQDEMAKQKNQFLQDHTQ